jgi:hypothetical protein
MAEGGAHPRGGSTVGATEAARWKRPRRWGRSGGRQWWLGGLAASVRHEGGKGRFKQREQAQRRGSPRGRVGGDTAANFYGEATAPGAQVAPRDRGEGSEGNRWSGVDEREMGQKMEWSGSRRLFKRLDGVGQRGKRGGGALWARPRGRGGRRGGGSGAVVDSAGRPTMAPGHRARAIALPHEQGRGRERATRCGRLTRRPE